MINKLLKTYGLLFLLSVVMISCKKDRTEPDGKNDVLTGAWQESGLTGGFARLVVFEPGGGFSLKASDKEGVLTTLSGKYTIEGDNLKVSITEQTERQANGSMLKTTVNTKLYENGKFLITYLSILTINHITYPADGPVSTISKFNKILPL
ncbi:MULTISPECIES: hypothetical protein [Pedobacter]|uniref:hypothetical protein n=1 Tax=Pedobacter TaxID=84567 RepID=UPI0029303D94|nr:hypothetical protein [Pedobacter aquatilis]